MPAFLRKAQTTRVSTDSHKPLLPNETITYDTREAAPKFPLDGKRYYSHISANNNPQILKSKVSACGGNHSSVKSDLSNQNPHNPPLKISSGDQQPEKHMASEGRVERLAGMWMWNSFLWRREDRFTRKCAQIYSFVFRTARLHFVLSPSQSNNHRCNGCQTHSKRPTSQRAISLKTTFFPANLKCFM